MALSALQPVLGVSDDCSHYSESILDREVV